MSIELALAGKTRRKPKSTAALPRGRWPGRAERAQSGPEDRRTVKGEC
jgi:hypothetical protein